MMGVLVCNKIFGSRNEMKTTILMLSVFCNAFAHYVNTNHASYYQYQNGGSGSQGSYTGFGNPRIQESVTIGGRGGSSNPTIFVQGSANPSIRIQGSNGESANPSIRIQGSNGGSANPTIRIQGSNGGSANPTIRIQGSSPAGSLNPLIRIQGSQFGESRQGSARVYPVVQVHKDKAYLAKCKACSWCCDAHIPVSMTWRQEQQNVVVPPRSYVTVPPVVVTTPCAPPPVGYSVAPTTPCIHPPTPAPTYATPPMPTIANSYATPPPPQIYATSPSSYVTAPPNSYVIPVFPTTTTTTTTTTPPPPPPARCCNVVIHDIQATVSCGFVGKKCCHQQSGGCTNTKNVTLTVAKEAFGIRESIISCDEAIQRGIIRQSDLNGVCTQYVPGVVFGGAHTNNGPYAPPVGYGFDNNSNGVNTNAGPHAPTVYKVGTNSIGGNNNGENAQHGFGGFTTTNGVNGGNANNGIFSKDYATGKSVVEHTNLNINENGAEIVIPHTNTNTHTNEDAYAIRSSSTTIMSTVVAFLVSAVLCF